MYCHLARWLSFRRLDKDAFDKVFMPYRSLQFASPRPVVRLSDSLRDGGHSHNLPEHNTKILKKSFIVRLLYNFVMQYLSWVC